MTTVHSLSFLFCLLGVPLLVTGNSTCYSTESCLFDSLMANYNSQVRPATGPLEPVDVSVYVQIKSIMALDEKNEVLQSVMAIRTVWRDSFLGWNTAEYPSSMILVNVKSIWLPDLSIVNSVDAFIKSTYQEDFRAYILSSGIVSWYFGGIFKTSCSMNLENYPFDKQSCSIIIQNWAYTTELVNLTSISVNGDNADSNGLWKIEKISTSRYDETLGTFKYPTLKIDIDLVRKTSYYSTNILLPCVFITMVSLCVFWMPPDCGERISLGITVLLAYSIFQIVVMDNTPTTSDQTPFISKLLMLSMALAAFSLVTSIVTVYIYFKRTPRRVPKWVRVIAFQVLARVYCLRDEIPQIEEEEENKRESTPVHVLEADDLGNKPQKNSFAPEQEISLILKELRYLVDTVKENKHEGLILAEWKLLAVIFDRVIFTASILIYVFSVIPFVVSLYQ